MRRRVMRALWGARSIGGKTPQKKGGFYGVSTIGAKRVSIKNGARKKF